MPRDDFPQKVKDIITKRAAYECSNPNCNNLCVGPAETKNDEVNFFGKVAHITAASEGGPRFDPTLSAEQRKSTENAIFLCSNCAEMIDKNQGADYPKEILLKWKEDHENKIRKRVTSQKPLKKTNENLDSVEERINTFYQKRLNELKSGGYHINIPGPARLQIHMISIDALNTSELFDLEPIFSDSDDYLRPPGCIIGRNIERNFQGLLVSCGPDPYSESFVGYVQLYRNGMIEAIDSSLLKPTTQLYGRKYLQPVKKIGMWQLERNIFESCEMYLKTLEKIGAGLPIYLYISYTHMKDYAISLVPYKSLDLFNKDSDIAKIDDILLPHLKIDSFGINFEVKLKSAFDIFWNAFNQPSSRNYDEKGKFIYNLF